nr:tetratricopeptide repeat protein [Methanospirillum hungatei]
MRRLGNRGIAYMQQQKFEAAITDLERAVSLNPDYVIGLNNLGTLYRFLEKNDKSREMSMRVLALEPGNEIAIGNLALLIPPEHLKMNKPQLRKGWRTRVTKNSMVSMVSY